MIKVNLYLKRAGPPFMPENELLTYLSAYRDLPEVSRATTLRVTWECLETKGLLVETWVPPDELNAWVGYAMSYVGPDLESILVDATVEAGGCSVRGSSIRMWTI